MEPAKFWSWTPTQTKAEIEREQERLARAAEQLGLSPRIDVALGIGESPTWEERRTRYAIELERAFVALVSRYEHRPFVVCGDSRSEVESRLALFPVRQGPNGPLDSIEWLREGQ